MNSLEVGVYISIAAVLISFIGLVLNGRKDTRSDAAQNAIIQTKLDSAISGINEIRVDLRSMQNAISDHGERLARVEARAASNTKRLDQLDGRKGE